jgi:hypothetical protein
MCMHRLTKKNYTGTNQLMCICYDVGWCVYFAMNQDCFEVPDVVNIGSLGMSMAPGDLGVKRLAWMSIIYFEASNLIM